MAYEEKSQQNTKYFLYQQREHTSCIYGDR